MRLSARCLSATYLRCPNLELCVAIWSHTTLFHCTDITFCHPTERRGLFKLDCSFAWINLLCFFVFLPPPFPLVKGKHHIELPTKSQWGGWTLNYLFMTWKRYVPHGSLEETADSIIQEYMVPVHSKCIKMNFIINRDGKSINTVRYATNLPALSNPARWVVDPILNFVCFLCVCVRAPKQSPIRTSALSMDSCCLWIVLHCVTTNVTCWRVKGRSSVFGV